MQNLDTSKNLKLENQNYVAFVKRIRNYTTLIVYL